MWGDSFRWVRREGQEGPVRDRFRSSQGVQGRLDLALPVPATKQDARAELQPTQGQRRQVRPIRPFLFRKHTGSVPTPQGSRDGSGSLVRTRGPGLSMLKRLGQAHRGSCGAGHAVQATEFQRVRRSSASSVLAGTQFSQLKGHMLGLVKSSEDEQDEPMAAAPLDRRDQAPPGSSHEALTCIMNFVYPEWGYQ
jgi:hypothetical protein